MKRYPNVSKYLRYLLLTVFLAGMAVMFVGCSTPEAENVSERPWTKQRRWEHGLPSAVYEGQ